MDPDLAPTPSAQQAVRQYNTELSGSAQAHLGDHIGDIHHHHYIPAEGRPETPPTPSSTVPFRRDADYIDRGTLLTQLEQKCAEPAARVTLVGIGGVGKSQLAIEYCHRLRGRSPDTWVFWVYSSTADRVVQGFREIAEEAKIPGYDDPQKDVFELVKKWLRKENRKWLLVLDNLDDDAVLTLQQEGESIVALQSQTGRSRSLLDYIPQTPEGTLLITTRTMAVAHQIVESRENIRIGPMTNTEATALLAKKFNVDMADDDLRELATTLEFMPLAIMQASAYIQRRAPRCNVREYIEQFNRNDQSKKGLLSYEAGHLRRDNEAMNSIINSWQISFDYIRQKWPSAANLLALMSFFDRQGIPDYVLTQNLQKDPDDESITEVSATFDMDVERLRDYCLVSVELDGHTFAMHRLVQLATRDWLVQHGQDQTQQARFLDKLAGSFPTGEYENWARCEELLPHVTAMEAVRPGSYFDDTSLHNWCRILRNAGWYAWSRGHLTDAERMCRKSVSTIKEAQCQDEIETAASEGMLSTIYLDQGRLKEAEVLQLEVIEVRTRLLGHHDFRTLVSKGNLASNYLDQGRLKEAEVLQMDVVDAEKENLGEDHRQTLKSGYNLANLYLLQGRSEEAESLLSPVLKRYKRVLGEEHLDTLHSATLLAAICRIQDRFQEAEALLTQVLKILERVWGQDSTVTLRPTLQLVRVYHEQGRLEDAEKLTINLVERSKTLLGEDHPDTSLSLECLGTILYGQGRLNEAEALQIRVLDRREHLLGKEHFHTLMAMTNLGNTLYRQRKLNEAVVLLTRCEGRYFKVFGPAHPESKLVSHTLAQCRTALAEQGEGRSFIEPPSPEAPFTAQRIPEQPSTAKRSYRKFFDSKKILSKVLRQVQNDQVTTQCDSHPSRTRNAS